jgi:hypothetical protein
MEILAIRSSWMMFIYRNARKLLLMSDEPE